MKIPQVLSRLAVRTFVPLLLAAGCVWTGCLAKPYLKKETFLFNPPPASTNVVNGSHVLGIRSLKIAAPFEGRSFVYRTGEFSYVRDPYAEFLESPAEELMAPVREALRRGAGFSALAEAGSALKPDIMVEIKVSRLFGDFRKSELPAAVMTVQFVFLDATNGVPGKVIFQKEYSRSIPLNAPTAAALMAGWNEALTGMTAEVSTDLRDLETGKR